jgi:hypothetical protein
VCEGKITEPRYFKEFQHHVRNRLVHVAIDGPAGVPATVVERAIALRNEALEEARSQRDWNLRFDEVWCVFDIDEHPNVEDACHCAVADGIQLAISSPCFELWALLHFRDQRESLHRHEAQRLIRGFLPNYDKEFDFSKLVAGYEEAVRRAQSLDTISESLSEPRRNPSTGVYVLTERIRLAGQP